MANADIVLPTAQVARGLERAAVAFSNVDGTTAKTILNYNRVVATDSDGKIVASSITDIELNMLNDIGTDTVKTQLDTKEPLVMPAVELNASGNLVLGSFHLVSSTTDPVVLTLPTGVYGRKLIVKCYSKGAGAITVKPPSGSQIDNLGDGVSVPITALNQSYTFYSLNATTWYII